MKRSKWLLPVSALIMVIGMAGCAGNNRAGVNERYNDNARPIGYYSNENHPNQTNALLSDNDGPLTEMMDHSLGAEGKIVQNQKSRLVQVKDKNGNPPIPTAPLATDDRNFSQHDNRFSISDANYSGHLNQRNVGFSADPKTLGKISDQIRTKTANIKNVRDVRSVVFGSSVLISVHLNDKSKAEKTKQAIRKAIRPYTDGRSVTILTDEGTLSRDRFINNDLREGGAK
ncbi:YhcN/YlaJ family sporulation lipoprotein [Neobacillus sp. PS3-40]|uniref:YhcN/YlaJ family sporulation lipoprotein n=1 Tax=Neobacillus sp. PS3-40 TaxID=3070679 RepID=UPI0027DF86DC|nr:YhcN/YlaJ family sporulation lipoprotein [Neobacillus sp. PS3-40]WML45525.1 YhcN/YlaJ family sporulation lipoprotein [Neobacillus sp. PS3-40]